LASERPGRTASFAALQADPDKVGGVAAAPFVRLADPATTFLKRSQRFAALAPDHPLEAYLLFLSRVAAAQHAAQSVLPPPRPLDADRLHAVPQLSPDLLDEDFLATLDWLLTRLDGETAPRAAQEARSRLVASSTADRLALARDVFDAAYAADLLGETLYVASALQVYLTRQAARFDATVLQPGTDGVCPACGGAPVASLVVGWTQASKSRYLCCSLCGTLWNYVRIKCTACGSTEGITYYTAEDGWKNIAAETCSACRNYLKHLHQHQDPQFEPFADDVASFGLDLLMRKEAFGRSGLNPFLIIG
jgi:FdhE protein